MTSFNCTTHQQQVQSRTQAKSNEREIMLKIHSFDDRKQRVTNNKIIHQVTSLGKNQALVSDDGSSQVNTYGTTVQIKTDTVRQTELHFQAKLAPTIHWALLRLAGIYSVKSDLI